MVTAKHSLKVWLFNERYLAVTFFFYSLSYKGCFQLEHYLRVVLFIMVLFIMVLKVVLTFETVDEVLKCDHSNESY